MNGSHNDHVSNQATKEGRRTPGGVRNRQSPLPRFLDDQGRHPRTNSEVGGLVEEHLAEAAIWYHRASEGVAHPSYILLSLDANGGALPMEHEDEDSALRSFRDQAQEHGWLREEPRGQSQRPIGLPDSGGIEEIVPRSRLPRSQPITERRVAAADGGRLDRAHCVDQMLGYGRRRRMWILGECGSLLDARKRSRVVERMGHPFYN